MDKMILTNMALVKSNVKSFIGRNPGFAFLMADLISHGSLGLVKAVNMMAGIRDKDDPVVDTSPLEGEKPNPSGFIGYYIILYLGKLIDQEISTVRVPNRTRQDRKKKGKDLFLPTKEASIDSSYTFEQEGQRDPRTMVDLMDEIEGCCETDTERQLIRHRIEGRSDQEISDIMGIPRISLNLMRRQIYARFKERNDEYDTDD